jgi:branched-chain amino acid transport system ATP-binding protein
MAPILQFKNVTKRYGGVVALNDVTLDIEDKQITGLIGPNGSGKTTAFNVVSGFARPEGGHVLYRGRDITDVKSSDLTRMGVARTFQTPQLFRTLTVRETVELAASAAGNDREIPRAIEIAGEMGLRRKLDYLPRELTTADMHALEIVKAFATGANLILLDEVFAGLNPIEIDRTAEIIRAFSTTKTFVIIEHRMRAVMALCQYIHVLVYGRLAASGLPEAVVSNPEIIAAYLGKEAAHHV